MTGKDSEGTYASYPKDTSALPQYKEAREAHIKAFGSEPGFGYYNAYAATQCLLAAIERPAARIRPSSRKCCATTSWTRLWARSTLTPRATPPAWAFSTYQVQGGKFVELDHSITLN